jgi:hypothetical protein
MTCASYGAADKRSFLRKFCADERGATMTMFGLAVPVLLGMAGMTIDYTRALTLQGRLQAAIDSASLASVALLRNGATQDQARLLGQQAFKASFSDFNASAATPNVNFDVQGTQFTANVSVQGSVRTTLSYILGKQSVSAGASAAAQALSGPTGGVHMGFNLSGGGSVWGDPHIDYYPSTGGTETANVTCTGGFWYNMLSDSGVQWNSVCLNDGSSLYFGGSELKVGTHTISFTPYEGPGFAGWWNTVDSFGDDCISGVGTAVNGTCGLAYAATLVVDGQTIDPTQYPDRSFTVVNDAGEAVTLKVQISNHALPAWFGTAPAGVYNYLSVDVVTAHYELTLVMPAGYQSAYATVSNAGMCGSPGGFFGAFIDGATTATPASYVISGPTVLGGQFDWTAVCGGNGGQVAHLIQ